MTDRPLLTAPPAPGYRKPTQYNGKLSLGRFPPRKPGCRRLREGGNIRGAHLSPQARNGRMILSPGTIRAWITAGVIPAFSPQRLPTTARKASRGPSDAGLPPPRRAPRNVACPCRRKPRPFRVGIWAAVSRREELCQHIPRAFLPAEDSSFRAHSISIAVSGVAWCGRTTSASYLRQLNSLLGIPSTKLVFFRSLQKSNYRIFFTHSLSNWSRLAGWDPAHIFIPQPCLADP